MRKLDSGYLHGLIMSNDGGSDQLGVIGVTVVSGEVYQQWCTYTLSNGVPIPAFRH